MQELPFEVTRTAHLYVDGQISIQTKRVFLILHGYGMLGSSMLKQCTPLLKDSKHCVVVPEGLSYFYWDGFEGKVVASWMTKQHRLSEIKDYSNYLSKVLHWVKEQCDHSCEVHLIGFSQGASTLLRWMHAHQPEIQSACLWAGWIPEDIDYDPSYFSSIPLHLLYGNSDPYLTEERRNALSVIMDKKALNIEKHQFEGKHIINESGLELYLKLLP